MKNLLFSLFLTLGTVLTVQAQLTIVVTNNSSGSYAYKLTDGDNKLLVHQSFGPGESATSKVRIYSFPMIWVAQNAQGCSFGDDFRVSMSNPNSGPDASSGSYSETTPGCGGSVTHTYTGSTDGSATLNVTLN